MHPIRNQYRTNFTKIMNRQHQYIATKSIVSYKKRKTYDIRGLYTDQKESNTTHVDMEKLNTENVDQRKANEMLKQAQKIEINEIETKKYEKTGFTSEDISKMAKYFGLGFIILISVGMIKFVGENENWEKNEEDHKLLP